MGGSSVVTLAQVWPRTTVTPALQQASKTESGQQAGPGGTRQGLPPAARAHLSSRAGRRAHRPLGWRWVQPRLKLSRVSVLGP